MAKTASGSVTTTSNIRPEPTDKPEGTVYNDLKVRQARIDFLKNLKVRSPEQDAEIQNLSKMGAPIEA